ncbi:protein croquemort-like [Sarcoptes scabiei]|nr:protein croquemort-like [Sarcoptes scabiei]
MKLILPYHLIPHYPHYPDDRSSVNIGQIVYHRLKIVVNRFGTEEKLLQRYKLIGIWHRKSVQSERILRLYNSNRYQSFFSFFINRLAKPSDYHNLDTFMQIEIKSKIEINFICRDRLNHFPNMTLMDFIASAAIR